MADGPEMAYRTYVEHHQPALRRLAFMLCQDWHRADDLLQNTLVTVFVKWDRVRAADDMDAYIRTVLIRGFLSERRTGWARRVVLVDATPEDVPSYDRDTAAVLTVRAAMAELPPRQRAVMVLRFWSDLSVEASAEALGCSAGTVKSQTARALATLRRRLPAETLSDLRTGPRS